MEPSFPAIKKTIIQLVSVHDSCLRNKMRVIDRTNGIIKSKYYR